MPANTGMQTAQFLHLRNGFANLCTSLTDCICCFFLDPQFFTSTDKALRSLEASVEDSIARAQRTLSVGNSAGEDQIFEQNIEIIFAVDLSSDVTYDELKSSLKFAEEHVGKVSL